MKTAIITGGAKGIGEAIVKKLVQSGYNVLINYMNSEENAIKLKQLLKNNVEIYKADITKRNEVANMVDYCIDKFGTVDLLVNNAGVSQYKLFTEVEDNEIDSIIDVNLKGAIICSQEVLNRYMIRNKKGNIVNISSIWGISGSSCEVLYSATKAGLIGFTKALAKELALSNIRVNCVAPGLIDTNMNKRFNENEMKDIIEQIPLNRMGTTEEVANLVNFISSDEAEYITGQVITIDGGMIV